MKSNAHIMVLFSLLLASFVGCKTTEVEEASSTKKNLTHIESNNRYIQPSELDKKQEYTVAVINLVLPKGSETAVSAELTFGNFKPRSNGKVYLQADSKTKRYNSTTQLVNEISMRSMDPPIGIFMLVDDVALGTENSPEIDEDIMTFTREIDSLLADENIQQVYLIPDSFSISYK